MLAFHRVQFFVIVGHTDIEIEEWRGSSSVVGEAYFKEICCNVKSIEFMVELCTYLTGRGMRGDSTGTWNKYQHNEELLSWT